MQWTYIYISFLKMAFLLVESVDHRLQVVSKDEYVTGNILSSGEAGTMRNMMQQLLKPWAVEVDHLNQEEFSASLLQHVRTVEVTSSGNTKYTLSDDEPYANYELSEDEYKPPSRKLTAKRRLFKESSKLDSSSDSNTDSSESFDFGRPELDTHDGSSHFGVNNTNTACASTSNNVLREQPLIIGDTLAVVTVRHSKVQIDMLAPMHAGSYVVSLFQKSEQNGEVILQGYVIKKKHVNHKCSPVQNPKKVAFTDTIRSDETTLTCNMERCCPKGTLLGHEKFIKQPIQSHVAILNYYSSHEETFDRQSHGTSSTKQITKLKQHCCLFCGELKTCIGRHLQIVHAQEEQVMMLQNLKGPEKVKALRKLRYAGDKNYNETVSREKRIAVRTPTLQVVADSIHCPTCSALIGRKYFSKHHLKCSKRQPDRLHRVNHIAYKELNGSNCDLDAKILQELLRDLQNDDVTEVIKSDKLIQGLGIYMSKSNRTMHQLKNSRAQMRRCARLLLIMRKMDTSIHHFKDCLVANKYSLILNATRILCDQSNETGKLSTLKHPTVALQIGPMISTLISRLRRFYLEQENLCTTSPEVQALESFSALHKSEFCVEITRDALNTANSNKFNSKKELPKPADIQKLRDHCKKIFEESYNFLLEQGFDFNKWKQLGQVLLCQIMVFNRRRPGEISRTLLDDYKNKKRVNQEQYEYLNRLEIICADMFTMIYIKAKRGRTLGIILQPDNLKGLDLFILFRKQAGISDDNPYLFPYVNKEGYLSASRALKMFTNECGAENPNSLTGTYLRKHAATMCQLFNLNENELKQMADFMGHTFDVHSNHYRMPEQTTQLINISRFLSVVGDKDVYKYRGKSWDELRPFAPPEDEEDEEEEEKEEHGNDELDVRDHSSAEATVVDQGENCSVLRSPFSVETVSSPVERRVTRRRVPPAKFQSATPERARHQVQRVNFSASPTSVDLVTFLANPANRVKKSPIVKQVRKRWNSREIEFMTEKFGEYLDGRNRLPRRDYIKRILHDNREIFQVGRTVPALYAWIQNQRSKR